MDYAFMFSAIESCGINRLSPEPYLRKLILGLHEKNRRKSSFCTAILGSEVLNQEYIIICRIRKALNMSVSNDFAEKWTFTALFKAGDSTYLADRLIVFLFGLQLVVKIEKCATSVL